MAAENNGCVQTEIVMLRDALEGLPSVAIPQGFSVRSMTAAPDVASWVEIWSDAEVDGNISGDLFKKEMGFAPAEVSRRCFLFLAPGGEPAGTASAWFDPSFAGLPYGRLHWVAAKRKFQGRGLGKAMVSFALNAMRDLGHERCYLVTHNTRLPAIRLYLEFGFGPRIGTAQELKIWTQVNESIASPVLTEAIKRASGVFPLEASSAKQQNNVGRP